MLSREPCHTSSVSVFNPLLLFYYFNFHIFLCIFTLLVFQYYSPLYGHCVRVCFAPSVKALYKLTIVVDSCVEPLIMRDKRVSGGFCGDVAAWCCCCCFLFWDVHRRKRSPIGFFLTFLSSWKSARDSRRNKSLKSSESFGFLLPGSQLILCYFVSYFVNEANWCHTYFWVLGFFCSD